jgi:Bacterial Ig domain
VSKGVSLVVAVAFLALSAATAQAAPAPFSTLTVERTGVQLGTVTDSLSQINCGSDCSGTYQADCLQGTPSNCTEPGENKRPTLTATVPNGFRVVWNRTCDQGSATSNPCKVEGAGFITAHFDDLSVPDVSLNGLAAGPVRGNINLAAGANDPETGIASVAFFVRGAQVGSDASAPYSVPLNTATLADGSATVVARATNQDGDQANSTGVTVTIDNTAPALTVTGPDNQTFGPGGTHTWTFTSSDATTGAPTVLCSLTPSGAAAAFAPCSPGAGSHSVSNLAEGAYTLRVKSTDGAGNVTERTRSIAIDATPAETQIDSGPADGSSSTATSASFTFSSEAGATFQCRVYPSALTPSAFGPCSGAGTHTASGFDPGSYAFEVVATDQFGNADGTPAKRTFTVLGTGTGGNGGNGGNGGGGGSTGGGTTGGGQPGGGVVAGQRIDALVQTFYTRFGRRTRVDKLTVVGAPQGAKVTVTCKGKRKACPFKRKVLAFKGRSLKLAGRFKRRKLPVGTTFTIVVSKPGLVAKTFRYKVRAGKFPAVKVS